MNFSRMGTAAVKSAGGAAGWAKEQTLLNAMGMSSEGGGFTDRVRLYVTACAKSINAATIVIGGQQVAVAMTIDIRDIDRLDDVRAVERLQKEAWGIDDLDVDPLTQLVAAKETGGQLIGAFDHQTLIGFVYGFVGLEQGTPIHHSHMLAVSPAHRQAQIGYRLKLAQRRAVLAQGITRITWTFDPLQSVNAHFNFAKLGVVSDRYKVDFYGPETSSFLHQIGTDRLWVTWLLNSKRVQHRLEGWPGEVTRSEEKMTIEIPSDINAIHRDDPQRALAWRESTRHAFSEAIAAGFLVEDFVRRGSVGAYVLTRGRKIGDLA
jgi:predicted GNAT superfamily acetyltransferase